MTPTSRNSLMIGGALIVIALLLTCGPLSGLFGPDAAKVEAPPVAAGPPEGEGESLDAAAAAAGAGAGNNGAAVAGLGQNGNGSLESGLDIPVHESAGANVAVAGTGSAAMPTAGSTAGTAGATNVAGAGVGAGTAAATAAAGSGTGSGSGAAAATSVAASTAPPVSAGPPAVPVASTTVASTTVGGAATAAAAAAAGATNAFDQAYAGLSGDGIDAAGKVVDRFAPPVAAVGSGALALNGAQRSLGSGVAGVRAPCDSPGAGCRNVLGGTAPPMPPANPPIRPGQPPTPPNYVP